MICGGLRPCSLQRYFLASGNRAAGCSIKSKRLESVLQAAGELPNIWKRPCKLRHQIRSSGSRPAGCREQSGTPEMALQAAGSNPDDRKGPCSLQGTNPWLLVSVIQLAKHIFSAKPLPEAVMIFRSEVIFENSVQARVYKAITATHPPKPYGTKKEGYYPL